MPKTLALRRKPKDAEVSPGFSRSTMLPASLMLTVILCAVPCRAGWFDGAWAFRRPMEVPWDDQKGAGEELAVAEFYTAGHAKPGGEDIRVATAEGKPVATHVLRMGPGDRASVVFELVKGAKDYAVYFGNENPAPPRPGVGEVKYRAGLHLEMHAFAGGAVDNFKQMEAVWERSTTPLGQAMIDEPLYGLNPFGPEEQWISKVSGSITAPIDGQYILSAWADDRGALYIDDKPILFVTMGPGDTRLREKVELTHGRHSLVLYHVNLAGPGGFSIVWQRPDSTNFETIPKTALGSLFQSKVGSLEENHKTLTADFALKYAGECFYAEGYSHRFHFNAHTNKTARAQFEWDFGDGQTATTAEVDHVYLADGIYPVTLTVHVGANQNAQTTKLPVSRDYAHLGDPPTDDVGAQSKVVESYVVDKLPDAWITRAVSLHQRAGRLEAAFVVAARLAAQSRHSDANAAIEALEDLTRDALGKQPTERTMKLWESIPSTSDLQPRAAVEFARLLLWRTGDFARAVSVLTPLQSADEKVKRLYGEALVLDQKAADGARILRAMPIQEPPERVAAVSGALARTIEYYITTGDWETGERAWENWQQQFPADFMGGYSVLLQTKLIDLKKEPAAAARVAEAFARAVPESSYAPQLLDRAAKLVAGSDPAKSTALHQLLKERYPEDPLAQ